MNFYFRLCMSTHYLQDRNARSFLRIYVSMCRRKLMHIESYTSYKISFHRTVRHSRPYDSTPIVTQSSLIQGPVRLWSCELAVCRVKCHYYIILIIHNMLLLITDLTLRYCVHLYHIVLYWMYIIIFIICMPLHYLQRSTLVLFHILTIDGRHYWS